MEEEKKYENQATLNLNKSRIIANAVTITLAIVFSVLVLGALYVVLDPDFSKPAKSSYLTDEQIARLDKAMEIIDKYYLYEYDAEKAVDGAIKGMVSSLENVFTYYENEEEFTESLNSGEKEEYIGIGVHLSFDSETEGIKVLGAMPGSPAEKAGIKAGDVILKVDDIYLSINTYKEAVDAIKGEENTSVHLLILRNEEELIELDIARVKISVSNVSSDIIDGIGYIKVYAFENGIYSQFKAEYEKLRNENVRGIIVDLRNNPGGLVDETLKMLNLFLPKADVLKLVDKKGASKLYQTDNDNELDIPLAVLVNGNSASASEIFASAVKDAKKGVVIGTQTFGKGVIQYVIPITSHGGISIVAAQYYTASGVVIQDNGIEPDIIVELNKEYANNSYIDRDKDLQLSRAIEYIKEQL